MKSYVLGRREERIETLRARIERLESYTHSGRLHDDPERWHRAAKLLSHLYGKLGILICVHMREVA